MNVDEVTNANEIIDFHQPDAKFDTQQWQPEIQFQQFQFLEGEYCSKSIPNTHTKDTN